MVNILDKIIIKETDLVKIIVNPRQFLKYHTIIIVKRDCYHISDLSTNEFLEFSQEIRKATKILYEKGTSITVYLRDKNSEINIESIHAHVIPRNKGDLKENNDIYSLDSLNLTFDYEKVTEIVSMLKEKFKQ